MPQWGSAFLPVLTPLLSNGLARGDILTFDPHAQNEAFNNTANSYVYEALLNLNKGKVISLKYANGLRNGANSDTHRCKQLTEHGEERCIKLREVAGFSAVRTIFQIVGPRKILHCLLGK